MSAPLREVLRRVASVGSNFYQHFPRIIETKGARCFSTDKLVTSGYPSERKLFRDARCCSVVRARRHLATDNERATTGDVTGRGGRIADDPVLPFDSVVQKLHDLFNLPLWQCDEVLQSAKVRRQPDATEGQHVKPRWRDPYSVPPTASLLVSLQYLHDVGVPGEQILRLPWILRQDQEMLRYKVALLQSGPNMFHCIPDGIAMCRFSLPTIRKYRTNFYLEREQIPEYKNRIYFIAETLQMPVTAVSETAVLYNATLPFIKKVLLLFQGNGSVSSADLLRDPWMFVVNKEQLFDIEELVKNKASGAAMLAHQLENDDRVIPVRGRNKDMEKKIEHLHRSGYSLLEIMRYPRVMHFALEPRMSERLQHIREEGRPLPPLYVLHGPEPKYEQYWESISHRTVTNKR